MIIKITGKQGSEYQRHIRRLLQQFCRERGICADIIPVDDDSDGHPSVIVDGFKLPCRPREFARSVQDAIPLHPEVAAFLERRAWLG